LDLTRRTLLGILKYPVPYRAVVGLWSLVSEEPQSVQVNDWIPPKGYFDCEQTEIDWLLSAFSEDDRVLFQSLASTPSGNQHGRAAFHAFDCSIMDIADDIAYGVHDLEDAIHLHLIERDQLDTPDFKHLYAQTTLSLDQSALLDGLFSRELSKRKQAIGELVNYFITAVRIEVTHPAFQNQLLHYNAVLAPEARGLLDYLIRMIYQHVIDSPEARISEHGGQMVVSRLFEAISANPHALLDMKSRSLYAKAEDKTAALRVVCDFIACMTDEFAYSMHQRLLGLNTRRFG
jgi:dGTPase